MPARMPEADDCALRGIGILVTRPEHQAAPLCDAIEALGGKTLQFPVLEITPARDLQALYRVIDALDRFDWAIFISANAVEQGLLQVRSRREWPAMLKVAAIGKRSAEALRQQGLKVDLAPKTRFNSEALLALPQMQAVEGQRVVIFRGVGGRELLAKTLRERGADVEYAQAYQRVRPQADPAPLLRRWANGEIDIVLVNSAESLANLTQMLGEPGQAMLKTTTLLVVSERMLPLANRRGFRNTPVLAENATDIAVLAALSKWAQGLQ